MKKKGRTKKKATTLFPLLLAALCRKSDTQELVQKCLNNVFRSLPHVHLLPLLSLLPALLRFDCADIVCKTLEIIGAASLASFETNEEIALEDEIVRGLISLLRSPKRKIAAAACNAVLDLSTTSIGRRRLLELSAIENLLICFIQESKTSDAASSVAADINLLKEDDYRLLLLQGATSLINFCTTEQLQGIPKGITEDFCARLKILWGAAHTSQLCSVGNISANSLAESIFRLSVNNGWGSGTVNFENVKQGIFDLGEASSIEQFFSEIWELSPMLIRDASKASTKPDAIFSPFIEYLGPNEKIPTFLPSILKNTVSCPAIASDELDINHIINEIKNDLGSPIVYFQDIRVVKTQCGERELHYFRNQSSSIPHMLSIHDIMKCEEAFRQGYSIALRGMEFRFPSIAKIADQLAFFFGQPSTGVNMYMTPSNSQGLARHSDDHCVFVCQLIGEKRWTIYPRSDLQLPRLYEDLEDETHDGVGCQHLLLKEGDVLYIPRGFPHEARTDADDHDNVSNDTGYSLHLTLAIEIEPPFEWEGFMQVSLCIWAQKEGRLQNKLGDDHVPRNLRVASVRLLHIAIKLIGNVDPMFRKACLVGAMSLSSSSSCDQKAIFGHLICKIACKSNFSDALRHLRASMQRNEDPLEHVRWMKLLNIEVDETQSLNILSEDDNNLFDNILIQHIDMADDAFVQVKSEFCKDVKFEDTERHYSVLLGKYREVRKQYSNGMLSLHSALHQNAT